MYFIRLEILLQNWWVLYLFLWLAVWDVDAGSQVTETVLDPVFVSISVTFFVCCWLKQLEERRFCFGSIQEFSPSLQGCPRSRSLSLLVTLHLQAINGGMMLVFNLLPFVCSDLDVSPWNQLCWGFLSQLTQSGNSLTDLFRVISYILHSIKLSISIHHRSWVPWEPDGKNVSEQEVYPGW